MKFENSLEAYDYALPEELIASQPGERGNSRLLCLNKHNGELSHHNFTELPKLLPSKALLIANNSKVLPARIIGKRPLGPQGGGGKIECLFLTPLPLIEAAKRPYKQGFKAEIEGLLKPMKHIKNGVDYSFGENISLTVLEKEEFGRCRLEIFWQGNLQHIMENQGLLPLPPYMRREPEQADYARYQTAYAKATGSVAAPTAGLHFTKAMIHSLQTCGFDWQELTLHVGYGTFSPVRVENIDTHVMHSEYVELSQEVADIINQAKAEKRPLIAIGTTSARTLEGIANLHNGQLKAYKGMINIFIRPSYKFNVIDGMVTNFHLPKSTLLMLASALSTREYMLCAYQEAIAKGYRFFSYGDAMLIY